MKQLKEGLDLHPRDLVLLLFDNIGFKILGRQASYDQWILVKIVVVPEAKLKEAGFYQDDAVEEERISRTPSAVWSDKIRQMKLTKLM